jgi:DNA-binding XRE family transcriptional regulator
MSNLTCFQAVQKKKQRRLEAQGWKFGSAKDFLNLTDEDVEYIELHLSLAALLTKRRKSLGYTQAEVADLNGSSQSRVAKMEAGDPSVSVDLLIRTLLALGVNRKQVGRAIGAAVSA